MNNIILIGFSQSGKTTVGKLLAEKTQQSFIELEEELELEHQKSIGELIAEIGMEKFRAIEKAAIEKLMSRKNKVVAVRSNTIVDEETAEILPRIGTVVYLQTDREELRRRLEQDKVLNPAKAESFDEDEFCQQIAKKEPLFFQISGIIIQTAGKTPEDIVNEILLLL
ncbi:hypothetical protein EII17_02885 [Clostridiales bacterium COT073_COT-073]|nr:hypothetical protein EII17_02885 [Clostridiales bacterium COT073_COT-073]